MAPRLLDECLLENLKQLRASRNAPVAVRKNRVFGQLGHFQNLFGQAVKNLVVAAVDVEGCVGRLEHARRAGIRTRIAMALGLVSREQMLEGGIAGHENRVVEQRYFDELALAGPLPREEGT